VPGSPRSIVTGVLITPAIAAELEPEFGRLVAAARRNGRLLSSDAEDVVEGIRVAAKASQRALSDRQGHVDAPTLSHDLLEDVSGVGTSAAASALGISKQAVIERCRRGGWKDLAKKDADGRWLIPTAAVEKAKAEKFQRKGIRAWQLTPPHRRPRSASIASRS
jgi:hypothetical protein